MPTVSFFLASDADPLDSNHPLWRRPLPDRRPPCGKGSDSAAPTTVGYGDLFTAVVDFCRRDGWAVLLQAVSARLERSVREAELTHLSLYLVKHGAFYHPVKLNVAVGHRQISFVVNVAASVEGRRTFTREVEALGLLTASRPFGWFPAVYGSTTRPLPMFLGDWLDGFHEFHLTRRNTGQEPAIIVWDGAETPFLLSVHQKASLYRQAAMILTACYDVITTHQIEPWHHAAGDFVVRPEGDAVAVRLITVRNYTPLREVSPETMDERTLLDNLTEFFIHLSLCMRLDRLDGIADIVWAPDACLAPMIDGFFQGLDLTRRLSGLPETLATAFRAYYGTLDPALLRTMAQEVAARRFDPHSEEHRVVHRRLNQHLHDLGRLMTTRR